MLSGESGSGQGDDMALELHWGIGDSEFLEKTSPHGNSRGQRHCVSTGDG